MEEDFGAVWTGISLGGRSLEVEDFSFYKVEILILIHAWRSCQPIVIYRGFKGTVSTGGSSATGDMKCQRRILIQQGLLLCETTTKVLVRKFIDFRG